MVYIKTLVYKQQGYHFHSNELNTTAVTGTVLGSLENIGLACLVSLWTFPFKILPHRKHDLGQGSLCCSSPALRVSLSSVRARIAATEVVLAWPGWKKLKFVHCNSGAVDSDPLWWKPAQVDCSDHSHPHDCHHAGIPKGSRGLPHALNFLYTHFGRKIPCV